MKTKHIIYLVIAIVLIIFIYNQTKSKENLLVTYDSQNQSQYCTQSTQLFTTLQQIETNLSTAAVPISLRANNNNIQFVNSNNVLEISQPSSTEFRLTIPPPPQPPVPKVWTNMSRIVANIARSMNTIDITSQVNLLKNNYNVTISSDKKSLILTPK